MNILEAKTQIQILANVNIESQKFNTSGKNQY